MRLKPLLIAAVAVGGSFCDTSRAGELYIAFWNVENLFDTRDDPQVEGDESFTPEGAKHWNDARLDRKLDNLARVLRDMNQGRGPDLLGLCEVENPTVVRDLLARLKPLRRSYALLQEDSDDGRGIDCALAYDRRVVRLLSSDSLLVSPRHRDILEAELAVASHRFHVFVNHWPSRYNPAEMRIAAAKRLRRRVDQLLDEDPAADFVIIGDLNDTPTDAAVQRYLRTWGTAASLRPRTLLNPMYRLHRRNRGSYVYENRWQMLDQIILSPGMLDAKGLSWKEHSAGVHAERYQLFFPANPLDIPRPNRSYTGDKFHADGTSDHLPVYCRIGY